VRKVEVRSGELDWGCDRKASTNPTMGEGGENCKERDNGCMVDGVGMFMVLLVGIESVYPTLGGVRLSNRGGGASSARANTFGTQDMTCNPHGATEKQL
jgi:hypothetical protein